MRFLDIIEKKRNGLSLSKEEIKFWIDGYVREEIPDYQVTALLMAIYFQDLNKEETAYLTEVMAESGECLDLSGIDGVKADKHSTGGVGDKTTLVLAPLVAAGGVKIAKMSGRGLGHTGGTLDKLESIPGFCTDLSPEEFRCLVQKIGIAVIGQTTQMVPADKKLYSLRDVTATVESIPLIASSVMSKKIAAGAEVIVLDVKFGSGAFMKTADRAEELARVMVSIGENLGRRVAAVISNMDHPLGMAIGNALEVKEAMQTLKGQGPKDLAELCITLAAEIFYLAGKAADPQAGMKMAQDILDSGAAWKKFSEFVIAQGGDPNVLENERLLPEAAFRISIQAPASGFIQKMDARSLGMAAMKLGAGRSTKADIIDPSVGIVCYKKTGDPVEKGDTLAMVHANDEDKVLEAKKIILAGYQITDGPISLQPLIHGIISSSR